MISVMRYSDRPFAYLPYPLRTIRHYPLTEDDGQSGRRARLRNAPTYSKPLPQLRPLYNDIAKTQWNIKPPAELRRKASPCYECGCVRAAGAAMFACQIKIKYFNKCKQNA